MSHTNTEKQRLLELLSDRALFGLSTGEEHELNSLKAKCPDVKDDAMDRIVALLESSRPQDSMPKNVRNKVLQTVANGSHEPSQKTNSLAVPTKLGNNKKRSNRRELLVAIVASAATLLLSMTFWGFKASAADRRTSLRGKASDITQVAWTATDTNLPVTGDVVWSTQRQEGYMLFRGLAVNDPKKEQYQLWIFDANQDERYPIDGGVFDVTSSGDVVVPIDAKIPVAKPVMFAVTVEKPGGVVVSDRSRLPVLAKVTP